MIDKFYTIYHSKKNSLVAKFNARKDNEAIALDHIKTFPLLAALNRLRKDSFSNNALFDSLVAKDLANDSAYSTFIGWSGMSIRSIETSKAQGKKVIVERGSSHIEFQSALLEEEYQKWGFHFPKDSRVIGQECKEYDSADYVVVPSAFVKKTFTDKGFPANKLFVNNFGSNSLFKATLPKREKFTVLYVGNLSVRKGLPYLFEALSTLSLNTSEFDVWFIGSISAEIQKMIPQYEKPNWKFFGHVGHHQLADLISQCSVAIHPSLEEGLSMVIPQLMSCGTPVIATTNTGGEDIIKHGETGFIIPIRSPQHIANYIEQLYKDRQLLNTIRLQALDYSKTVGTWNHYGDRYSQFLKSI